MQEIEQLKEAEKENWDDGVSAEAVDYLKVTEEETVPSHPIPAARSQRRRVVTNNGGTNRLFKLAAAGAGVWLLFTIVGSGLFWGNMWALFLLFPIFSNLQAINDDRRNGMVTRQTKRHLSGIVFGSIFMAMFLTGAWNLMFPALLIGWGVTQLLYSRWRSEVAFL